jgi:hypothetical protein
MIKLRRMRWARHVAHMGEMRDAYRVLVRKSGHRLEQNVKMLAKEMG